MRDIHLDGDQIPETIAEAEPLIPPDYRPISVLAFPGHWASVHAVLRSHTGAGLYAPDEEQAIFRFGSGDDLPFR